ncbi:hypothetical protein A9Q99_19410 [Gammaproteobacteria bacterium 45_16_T64]|nr:hypothetical protein A9Q99_19410 [Gammaproteobacteria bacterium 45_16_T64]
MKYYTALFGMITLLLLSACSHTRYNNQDDRIVIPTLGVEFSWQGMQRCLGTSPQVSLSGVPPNTQFLEFVLKDIYFPFFPHGGGHMRYTGINTIPEGEIANSEGHFIGPCAPPFFPGQYEFTVRAIDSNNHIIALGQSTRPFPHR